MKRSFTLIELIMVIVIIGVLAAITLPRYIDLRGQARRAGCEADLKALQAALYSWYSLRATNNLCPSGNNGDCVASGFPVASQLQGDDTYFADHFMATASLPPVSHITGADQDWAAHYNPATGSIDTELTCP